MDKKQFIYNIFAVFLLVGVALIFTYFSKPIRQTVTLSQKLVAGASTEKVPMDVKLPSELSKDLKSHSETLKNQLLQVELGDVINYLGRTGKIIQDVRSIPQNITEFVENVTPN